MVAVQRAAASGGNLSTVPASPLNHNTPFSPTFQETWLNGLWLISLALTLSTALLVGLIKQWLHYYLRDVIGSFRHRACVRQFRFMGLNKWAVSLTIEFLPVLMNISLFLFFIGLVLFSHALAGTKGITSVLAVLTSISFAFYLGTSIWPLFNPQCPYKTSLTDITLILSRRSKFSSIISIWLSWKLIHRCMSYLHPLLVGYVIPTSPLPFLEGIKIWLSKSAGPIGAEEKRISKQREQLEIEVISYMTDQTSNPSVPNIALQSLAALHGRDQFKAKVPSDLWERLAISLDYGSPFDTSREVTLAPKDIERLTRALQLSWLPERATAYGHRRSPLTERHVLTVVRCAETLCASEPKKFLLYGFVSVLGWSRYRRAISCESGFHDTGALEVSTARQIQFEYLDVSSV